MESQPIDDNLKIATLVNLQQHLLLSVRPTSTWQNVREIVENYYSSTFVPNPTTGHIAYLAHGSPEEQLNYVKGRRKGKGKGGKGKKGGDYHKGKGKSKGKGTSGDNKGKEKDTTKEEKDTTKDGIHGIKEDTAIKDKERTKEKEERQELLRSVTLVKSMDMWQPTVGTRTLPTLQQPVALMPRDQLPLYNQHGQCISGTYMQATTAPRAATSSTASYITTPGPVLHDISHVHDDGDLLFHNNLFEINYNRQLTSSMNHNYASELPAHYLKHWGLLVDTGAYVSVAPRHFAPEVPLEPVPHPVQLLTATSTPIKIYGTKTVLLVTGRLSFHVRFYITDVKQTLLGLQDLLQGDLQLTLRDIHSSTIKKDDIEEPLLFHDKHFYVEALVLPQDHQLNYLWLHYLQNQLFRTTTTVYYTTGDGEVQEQVGEAQLPRSSKPPQLPTEEEMLLPTDSPTAHYRQTQKQQYYN